MADTQKQLAMFVTGDEGYFAKAATALLSFKRFFPQWDYFIVSDCKNNDVIEKTQKIGINVLYSNQHDTFPKTQQWPSQCMWGFRMPKIFHEMGYKYSCQIDGDVFCRKPFDPYWLNNKTEQSPENEQSELYQDFDIIGVPKGNFTTTVNNTTYYVINSGVVWYNNETLTDKKYYEKGVEIYRKNNSNVADQFVINQIISDPNGIFKFVPLPIIYNRLLHASFRDENDDSPIVHFTGNKPWTNNVVFSCNIICQRVKEWMRFAMKSPYLIDGLNQLVLGKQVINENKFEFNKLNKE